MSSERNWANWFHFMVVIVDNGLQLIYLSTINEHQVIEMVQFSSPSLIPSYSHFFATFTQKKYCGSLNLFAIKFKIKSYTVQIDIFLLLSTRNAMRNKWMCVSVYIQVLIKWDEKSNIKTMSNIQGFVTMKMWKPVPSQWFGSLDISCHSRSFFSCAKKSLFRIKNVCRYVGYKKLSWAMKIYENYLWLCRAISNYAHLHTVNMYVRTFVGSFVIMK